MAYTTIDNPAEYFNTKLYTGTGATQSITGVGFKPDFVWIKSRSTVESNRLQNAVIGPTFSLASNTTQAEGNLPSIAVTSFDTDGFSIGNDASWNTNGATFVSWNWLASNTTTANTSGSISSTVSANTTSGFSIVSYTGNGTGNSTVGHGLGAVPKFMIVKKRDGVEGWGTLTASFVSAADPNILYLNNTAAEADDTNVWGTSANFTSTTFTVGTWNGSNANASTYICYCWSEIKGYSKFGKYTGNGSADGTFIYTGFKPAFIIFRRTSTGDNWVIKDSIRDPNNVAEKRIYPNQSAAEDTSVNGAIDILSNGFKNRSSNDLLNQSGDTYIYMAFAENPFVSSTGIPTTAR